MRHFSPRSQVVKWVQRKSIVRNCLPTILPRNARSNGRQTSTSILVLGRSQFVDSEFEIFWGFGFGRQMSLCLEGFEVWFCQIWVLSLAHCQPSRFKLREVRFTVQKNLSIHTKFKKVRSNSSLNHDELERLDNRFMNASQPLEDDWRKSKISSDIS